jgi:hypothetical protein
LIEQLLGREHLVLGDGEQFMESPEPVSCESVTFGLDAVRHDAREIFCSGYGHLQKRG